MYRVINNSFVRGKSVSSFKLFFISKFCTNNVENSKNLELAQGYVPRQIENGKNLENNRFLPEKNSEKIFSMILPPPNITGDLHLGHALTGAIEDAIIRWKKMQGFETVWVPGLDHAGIATQVVVEKLLLKEKGLTRHDIGREKFVDEVLKWKEIKAEKIIEQLKKLNLSLNWEKQLFTMDKSTTKAVQKAFIILYEKGLIYRSDHLVNWSCYLQSAISDIEVEHLNIEGPTKISVPGYQKPVEFGHLYKFAYKLKDTDDEIIVSTTRVETMLADVAVAVHPKDSRYTKFIGKKLIHPFREEEIPLIFDEFVDTNFGTGAVKITPAHNADDFEVGKRHNLPLLQGINERGYLTALCPKFEGIKRFDAKSIILNELADMNLLRGNEPHSNSIPICSRSKDVIELLVKPQWFLNCKKLAQKAITDVESGKLSVQPAQFEKIWFNWLENIRDWCVSRQLWWGHRIPAYFCKDKNKNETWVAAESKETALEKAGRILKCNKEDLEIFQDEDVLDTWFSSALQPFVAFGWPEKTEEFDKFYPISLMETGHDIIFFWVARMVMLGSELTGKLPFNKILLHGIICDSRGRKMSKSLGNVVAPEQVIIGCNLQELEEAAKLNFSRGILSKEELETTIKEQKKMFPQGIPECGSDALKFTLLSHNIKSHYINFDVGECHANKLFCNKIWQATKFTLHWCQVVRKSGELGNLETSGNAVTFIDEWILSRLSFMVETVEGALERCDFHVATSSIKNFLYYEFCDVYLEATKRGLRENNEIAKSHASTLLKCLDVSLRILYPFMPVLSQHLYEHLPVKNVGFPKKLNLRNEIIEKEVEDIMEIIVSIRRLKKIFNVTAKYNPEAHVISTKKITEHSNIIQDLTALHKLKIYEDPTILPIKNTIKDTVGPSTIHLVVPDELKKSLALDLNKIQEKEAKLLKELSKIDKMMSGEGYSKKASLEEQENHFKKVTLIKDKLNRLKLIRELSQ